MKQRGLSLAEVLVALGVAAIVILTLAAYIASIHRAAREGEGQALASIIARSTLEDIRTQQSLYDQVAVGTYTFTQNEIVHPNETSQGSRVFVVDCAGTATLPDLLDVVVRVSWQEGRRTRTIYLESRFPRPASS